MLARSSPFQQQTDLEGELGIRRFGKGKIISSSFRSRTFFFALPYRPSGHWHWHLAATLAPPFSDPRRSATPERERENISKLIINIDHHQPPLPLSSPSKAQLVLFLFLLSLRQLAEIRPSSLSWSIDVHLHNTAVACIGLDPQDRHLLVCRWQR